MLAMRHSGRFIDIRFSVKAVPSNSTAHCRVGPRITRRSRRVRRAIPTIRHQATQNTLATFQLVIQLRDGLL